jgi:sRNA-binding regulator protein Hfq
MCKIDGINFVIVSTLVLKIWISCRNNGPNNFTYKHTVSTFQAVQYIPRQQMVNTYLFPLTF